MPKYDFHCSHCDTIQEYNCHYADRDKVRCAGCATILEPLFSPPTQIVIPRAFGPAYSDLYGTSSEKDYRKAHPELEVISPSRTYKGDKQKKKDERDKVIKEGLEVEKTLLAQGNLRRPIKVEAASMDSDV